MRTALEVRPLTGTRANVNPKAPDGQAQAVPNEFLSSRLGPGVLKNLLSPAVQRQVGLAVRRRDSAGPAIAAFLKLPRQLARTQPWLAPAPRTSDAPAH